MCGWMWQSATLSCAPSRGKCVVGWRGGWIRSGWMGRLGEGGRCEGRIQGGFCKSPDPATAELALSCRISVDGGTGATIALHPNVPMSSTIRVLHFREHPGPGCGFSPSCPSLMPTLVARASYHCYQIVDDTHAHSSSSSLHTVVCVLVWLTACAHAGCAWVARIFS